MKRTTQRDIKAVNEFLNRVGDRMDKWFEELHGETPTCHEEYQAIKQAMKGVLTSMQAALPVSDSREGK